MKTIIIIPLFLAVLVTAVTNSIYDFKDVNNDPVKAVELPDGMQHFDKFLKESRERKGGKSKGIGSLQMRQ